MKAMCANEEVKGKESEDAGEISVCLRLWVNCTVVAVMGLNPLGSSV